jgi:hypothetical protein
MTHDPLCEWRPCTCPLDYDVPERGHMIGCPEDDCECEIIAKVRADEKAKYVLPDLPRGGEHVDWCRDLACYGCEEIADGVIAQDV